MAETSDREQRTEEATPRRREEARERGQVAMSSEMIAAVGLSGGVGFLMLGATPLLHALSEGLHSSIATLELGRRDFEVAESAELLGHTITHVLPALCAVVIPIVTAVALAGFFQVGFRLTPKALEADPAKLHPLRGLERMISPRGIARTALSLLKILLIGGVAGFVAWTHVDEIIAAGTNEIGPVLAVIGAVVLRTTVAALSVILVLAALDMLFQRLQLARDLRMTRAEVKEEHRLTEGDPHVRARIRAVQREFAMRRMMADVPKATVVVTNPTHYAVALKYERDSATPRAPRVVAKGIDHLAERIKAVARASGVTCHEDVALARALHARVAIGQEIPEELNGAVAAVLAAVYRAAGSARVEPALAAGGAEA